MPRALRILFILVPLGIVAAAVGVWINNTLKKPVEAPLPPTEVATHRMDDITFEVEHEMKEGVNLFTSPGPGTIFFSRRGDILNYHFGLLTINDISLPDVKPGDTVRWNLSGPVLVNGQPLLPHGMQPVRIEADPRDLDWPTRESPAPRDTLSVQWLGVSRKFVAAHGDGAVRVWDADTGKVVHTMIPGVPTNPRARGGYGLRAAADPNGKRIAVTNLFGDEVTRWDAETGAKLATFTSDPKGPVAQVEFANEQALLEARGGKLRLRPLDGSATKEFGAVHDQFEAPFAVHARAGLLAWQDGKKTRFGPILAATFEKEPSSNGCLAFSADGKRLAEYDGAMRLAILDPATGKEVKRLRWRQVAGEATDIHALAFDPSGQTLAVGSSSSIRFYDVATGRERGGVACPWVRALAYSADGRTLVAALQRKPGLRLWETVDLRAAIPNGG